MSSVPQVAATIDDLYRVEGKAELIGGRIVPIMPTGHLPNVVAFRIARSLAGHVDNLGRGVAYTDNMGFAVPELSSGRQSFSPDVSYYLGPLPFNPMRFVEGPPTFAVEVRSEGDYTPSAEIEMAAKRADYFEAGTWSSGTWTRLPSVFMSIAPRRQISPKVTRAARRLTRNRSCPVGGSPSTGSSLIKPLLSCMTHGNGRMSQVVTIELEIPDDLAHFRLPPGVQDRLQALLDRQDKVGTLTMAERQEAEGLVNLAELLSLLRLRAERASAAGRA